MATSSRTADQLVRVLVSELGSDSAERLVRRIQVEVDGNQSFTTTIAMVLKRLTWRPSRPKALPIYYVAYSGGWFLCRAQNKRAAEREARREWGWNATEVRRATKEEIAHYEDLRPGAVEEEG